MKKTFPIFLFLNIFCTTVFADKVLVTIGDSGQITEQQLESAMQAAPFASQFPVLDERDQAYLRGDILLRLARAEALYQEAVSSGKTQSDAFLKEMGNFKTTLLAQQYLINLRKEIKLPSGLDQQFKRQTQGNSDALTAARSAYIANHFTELKNKRIKDLIKQADVHTYFERLNGHPDADTLLAQGHGVLIKYGDVSPPQLKTSADPSSQQIIDKVNEWIVLTLMARNAEAQGVNIDNQLTEYAHNLAIRLLLSELEQQWIPDQQTLIDYFQKHPNIGYIPERRQIGQIVLSSRQQAEAIRKRILAGESLFELAGQYSVDLYGRQRSGDMGWLAEGSATGAIETALKNLPDNTVSEVIKTDKGWHLIIIVNRKPSEQKDFAAIKDRVRQKLIAEKMTGYLQEIESRHPMQWLIADYGK